MNSATLLVAGAVLIAIGGGTLLAVWITEKFGIAGMFVLMAMVGVALLIAGGVVEVVNG